MLKPVSAVQKFLKDEEGQSMVEYGITLGGVAAVSYLAIVVLGDKTGDLYAWMANHMPGGESGETAQVRVDRDGLVGTDTLTNADGVAEEVFAARTDNGANQTADWTLNGTLGTSSYFSSADGGWNVD
ncbi:MAG TPA: hypothetical protein PLX20_11535 [Rhodocyclaceae bacterium]|jgi:Flp pilus assembly pilin Flp|nr:hypothetical protein [Rhodocyclaceae bacterium]HNB78683.1 hypothetical protein [Rhodocyclaceae bacterium]HNH13762.1 hypothetical protein [Rhodocyclaceae bacterium]HNH98679.1 hypothetical protein [Rhodocyclaceae bacterium]